MRKTLDTVMSYQLLFKIIFRNLAVLFVAGSSLVLFASAFGPPPPAPAKATAQDLPDGPAKATFIRVCSGCHEPEVVVGNHNSRQDWVRVVNGMIGNGAQGTDDEFDEIVSYLTANFGPQVNVNTASEKDLTDGLGLTVAEAAAIVAYRKNHDKFASVDDLKKIPGVDAARIDAAKDRIAF